MRAWGCGCVRLFLVCVLTCAFGPVRRAGAANPAGGAAITKSRPIMPSGTYDAGEALRIGTREIRLLRSRQKVAVLQAPTEGLQAAQTPEKIEIGNRLYLVQKRLGNPRITVMLTRKFTSLDEQTESMQQLQEQVPAAEVVPVYVNEASGLEMIPTGSIVVRLKAGAGISGLATLSRQRAIRVQRRIRGTTDQYILSVPHTTARELFETCTSLRDEPFLEWAEPDFVNETVKCAVEPNDPFFTSDQWYLRDIRVPQAWESTTGSSQIIIAFLDDGMDLKHEDLRDALPSNTGEIPDNGRDDDGNGWVDDATGWNFHDNNNNPSPGYFYDNHGTQVAGVAAATGNNGKGIAGCAFGCRLMPLKVLAGDPFEEKEDVINTAIAEALYYAAGRTEDGQGRWRGADVISISLGFSETNLIDAALQYATQEGRNGKGCATFCASGNGASGWLEYRIFGFEAGTYDFRWELARDKDGGQGENTAWLSSIAWPGTGMEPATDAALPAGWQTGGDAKWVVVESDAGGNHTFTGWGELEKRSFRPEPVPDWGRSYLEMTKTVAAGDLRFWLWTSLEESYSVEVGDFAFALPDLWPFGLLGLPQQRRMQFICLREELGWDRVVPVPIRRLKFAEFYVFDAPTGRIDALTIRMKQVHFGRDRYDQAEWDDAGWTTVFEATNIRLDTGPGFEVDGVRNSLVRFDFTREFTYDPNYNLAVDICLSDSAAGTIGAWSLTSDTVETRAIVGEDTFGTTSPVSWQRSEGNAQLANVVPVMWLGSGDEVRFFVDGMLYGKASGVPIIEPQVAYPASNPQTVAVGACTDFGYRSDYSQFGLDLDFVAPSSGGRKDILSTDRTGSKGEDEGDYYAYFGGTSAATPLASGVAALMLSKNPSLRADRIRTILRQTSQKIGDEPYVAGRNDHYGYGRIDAAAALDAVPAK
jgi:subtilisin family serine protease